MYTARGTEYIILMGFVLAVYILYYIDIDRCLLGVQCSVPAVFFIYLYIYI